MRYVFTYLIGAISALIVLAAISMSKSIVEMIGRLAVAVGITVIFGIILHLYLKRKNKM